MKRYDFIVGFTTFYPGGFKTRYQHFDDLKVAKMFANNKNLKNTSKIYVDLEYYQELENINKQNIQEIERLKDKLNKIYNEIDNKNSQLVKALNYKLFIEDKIKAKIEESELLIDNSQGCMSNEDLYKEFGKIEFGKSLLEKE